MYTPIKRYHSSGGYHGYSIPAGAIVGSSDTGRWEDSPCPSDKVFAELQRFRKEVLRPLGIKSRQNGSQSSNCFMVKRWLCVAPADFDRAARAALEWLEQHQRDTHYIHDADLEKCVIKEAA